METITPQQTLTMAEQLSSVQATLTTFKLNNYTTLSAAAKTTLDDSLSKTSDTADKLYAKTVILQFENVQDSLNSIKSACDQINQTLNAIATTQKVIDLIATVASFATAIISQNPTGIANSASSIITSIQGL